MRPFDIGDSIRSLFPDFDDMHVPTPIFGGQNPTVRLCGNGHLGQCDCLRFEHYGAVFDLPVRLELMSDVFLSVEWCRPGYRRRSVRIAGIVVGCRDSGDGCFETSVIFLLGVGACASAEFRHLPN